MPVKSRLPRSGDAIGSSPAIIVRHGLPRRLAPQVCTQPSKHDGGRQPLARLKLAHFLLDKLDRFVEMASLSLDD